MRSNIQDTSVKILLLSSVNYIIHLSGYGQYISLGHRFCWQFNLSLHMDGKTKRASCCPSICIFGLGHIKQDVAQANPERRLYWVHVGYWTQVWSPQAYWRIFLKTRFLFSGRWNLFFCIKHLVIIIIIITAPDVWSAFTLTSDSILPAQEWLCPSWYSETGLWRCNWSWGEQQSNRHKASCHSDTELPPIAPELVIWSAGSRGGHH